MKECKQCGVFYRVDAEYRWSTCRKCHEIGVLLHKKKENGDKGYFKSLEVIK